MLHRSFDSRKEKFKNLSLFDEYRVRILEGLPTRRIEKKILKQLRSKTKRKRVLG